MYVSVWQVFVEKLSSNMKWVILAELHTITAQCNSTSSLWIHEILQPLRICGQSVLDYSLQDAVHESAQLLNVQLFHGIALSIQNIDKAKILRFESSFKCNARVQQSNVYGYGVVMRNTVLVDLVTGFHMWNQNLSEAPKGLVAVQFLTPPVSMLVNGTQAINANYFLE